MNCPKCNTANNESAKVCEWCGAPLTPTAPPPGGAADNSGIPEFARNIITPGLIARVKGILLSPVTEWPLIDAETTTANAIYMHYVAPLAAIGAIAGLIGRTVVGVDLGVVGTFRVPFVSGLVTTAVGYALTFAAVYVAALVIDGLAPTFGGQKDSLRALKIAAYSNTPGWLAGIVLVIPSLAIISVVAAAYGIYILYLGLPVLMRSPGDKAVGYTAAIVVSVIVVYLVIGAITASVMGSPTAGGI